MTDITKLSERELLELAAEAAGHKTTLFDDDRTYLTSRKFLFDLWNPLKNDADAFRLMCDLSMSVVVSKDYLGSKDYLARAVCFTDSEERGEVVDQIVFFSELKENKSMTCLAITRCAALVALERRKK